HLLEGRAGLCICVQARTTVPGVCESRPLLIAKYNENDVRKVGTMTLKTSLCSLLAFGLFYLSGTVASAAERTVCYRLRLEDDRDDCPTSGVTGVRRACDPGNHSDLVGVEFELWDKDGGSGSSDEYIGTYRVAGTGTRCVIFEWENASYSNNEANPDVFVKMHLRTSASASGPEIIAVDDNGDTYAKTSWRNGTSADDDAYTARNCKVGESCDIGELVPTHDPDSDRGQSIQIIDSAQRVLEIYEDEMDSGNILAWYPDNRNQDPDCGTGVTWTQHDFCIPSGRGDDGDLATHEMGHIVHMQMYDQNSLSHQYVGGGWNMTSVETESAATVEGWAAYVAAVAWYNPQTNNVVPFYGSFDLEEPEPFAQCTQNREIALQVAKSFWDYDDDENEDGDGGASAWDDRSDKGTRWMARQWKEFPDGNGNRENGESDADGPNLWDYINYACSGCSSSTETLLEHNCVQNQTTG
ncbi:MAG: hypothetical protein V3W44_02890, partial [Dehalococcoidales bacterium]